MTVLETRIIAAFERRMGALHFRVSGAQWPNCVTVERGDRRWVVLGEQFAKAIENAPLDASDAWIQSCLQQNGVQT